MYSIGIPELGAGTIGILAIISGAFVFMVHIIMALAVNGDAKRLEANRGGLFLFGPFLWGGIVLIFGLPGLAVYWVVHHSTLRDSKPPQAR